MENVCAGRASGTRRNQRPRIRRRRVAVGTRPGNRSEVIQIVINPLNMQEDVVIDQLVRVRCVIEENQMPGIRSDKDMPLVVGCPLVQKPADFIGSANRIALGFGPVRRKASCHLVIVKQILSQIDVRNHLARFRVYLHNVGIAEQENRIRIFVKARSVRAFQRIDQRLGL